MGDCRLLFEFWFIIIVHPLYSFPCRTLAPLALHGFLVPAVSPQLTSASSELFCHLLLLQLLRGCYALVLTLITPLVIHSLFPLPFHPPSRLPISRPPRCFIPPAPHSVLRPQKHTRRPTPSLHPRMIIQRPLPISASPLLSTP